MPNLTCEQIIEELYSLSDPIGLEVMARFGDRPRKALGGISAPQLKAIAKRAGRGHDLAAELWATGINEARLVAAMVDEPARVTEAQTDAWAAEFDSWAICD